MNDNSSNDLSVKCLVTNQNSDIRFVVVEPHLPTLCSMEGEEENIRPLILPFSLRDTK